MSFKQRSFLDLEKLTNVISKKLNIGIDLITPTYQELGSQGHVNKIDITLRNGENLSYIVKKSENTNYLELYNQILLPLKLSHPKIHFEFEINDEKYYLMDFISHKLESEWDREDYKKVIKWLATKDTLTNRAIKEIKNNEWVKREVPNSIDEHFIETFPKALENKTVDQEFVNELTSIKSKLLEWNHALINHNLSLNHSDFVKNNILIEKFTSKIYTIDWTWAKIGNVCNDLSTFLSLSNLEKPQEEFLLDLYTSLTKFENVKEEYNYAKAISTFGQIGWMLKTHMKGSMEFDYEEIQILQKNLMSLFNIGGDTEIRTRE